MSQLLDANILKGGSEQVSVTENTVISINANGPFHVKSKNGTGGFVPALNVIESPYVASFVAPSDELEVESPFTDIHLSIYDDA